MPEVILTENPYDNPWDNPWGNPRKRRRKGGRKGARNPTSNPRGRLSLQKIMSPQGIMDTLNIERTGGIATGLIGFQKVSEAIKQTGFLDAVIVLAGGAVAGTALGGSKFMNGVAEGGIVLGLLKILMLIPGTADLVSSGSLVLGGRTSPRSLGNPGASFPRSGVSNKLTFAGGG